MGSVYPKFLPHLMLFSNAIELKKFIKFEKILILITWLAWTGSTKKKLSLWKPKNEIGQPPKHHFFRNNLYFTILYYYFNNARCILFINYLRILWLFLFFLAVNYLLNFARNFSKCLFNPDDPKLLKTFKWSQFFIK